jgi:hypothetical protein
LHRGVFVIRHRSAAVAVHNPERKLACLFDRLLKHRQQCVDKIKELNTTKRAIANDKSGLLPKERKSLAFNWFGLAAA